MVDPSYAIASHSTSSPQLEMRSRSHCSHPCVRSYTTSNGMQSKLPYPPDSSARLDCVWPCRGLGGLQTAQPTLGPRNSLQRITNPLPLIITLLIFLVRLGPLKHNCHAISVVYIPCPTPLYPVANTQAQALPAHPAFGLDQGYQLTHPFPHLPPATG